MTQAYSDCIYCGGEVREERVTREVRWQGRLYIFDNAPVGVCQQCGARYVSEHNAGVMDAILLAGGPPERTVPVPAYSFPVETEAA